MSVCDLVAFRIEKRFYFLYSALSPFSYFPYLIKNLCPDTSELMGTQK